MSEELSVESVPETKQKKKYRRYTDKDREDAIALYMITNNYQEVADTMHIPPQTIQSWVTKGDLREELVKIREKRREEFAQRAWDGIEAAQLLVNEKLNSALNRREAIDETIRVILDCADKDVDVPASELNKLIKLLRAEKGPTLKELIATIATLYDKQALARGEATTNAQVAVTPLEIKFTGDLDKWSK